MNMSLRKHGINRSSIKEAVDTLPAGICYFSKSGIVKLCNQQMFRLYHTMAQAELQTLAELHSILVECDEHTGILRLPGRKQVYLFPDGKAWKYTESIITAKDGNTYTEVLFSDVTELYEKKIELEKQIQKLKQISRKIKELSENVVEATREREILQAKTRLHSQMSENLTMMRQTLIVHSPRKAQDAAVHAMQQTVRFLMADSEEIERYSGFDEFLQTASNSGVTVSVEGVLPKQKKLYEVFVIAMRECLTNCVLHGEADELYVLLSEKNDNAVCTISNNGAVPKEEIKPQGGLKNLHRHVLNCGGKMDIQCTPVFALTITIPEKNKEIQ